MDFSQNDHQFNRNNIFYSVFPFWENVNFHYTLLELKQSQSVSVPYRKKKKNGK